METLHHCDNDALLVDDLLDFSNGDIGGLCEGVDDCGATVPGKGNDILCSQKSAHHSSEATGLRSLEESIKAAEPLYSPPDELADIEWLSSFVDESYTADTSLLPLLSLNLAEDGGRSESQWGGRGDSEWYQSHWFKSKDEWERPSYKKNDCEGLRSTSSLSVVKEANPFIETPSISTSYESSHSKTNNCSSWGKPTLLKGRTRSKRSRSGGRIWSLHMLVPFSNRINERPAHHDFEDVEEEEEEDDLYSQVSSLDYEPYSVSNKPKKKAKKAPSSSSSSMAADDGAQQGRRCSHCQVQKTPQWRAGPLGPKTLCNACGVRYKSGRLVPEYRPAASPTFVTEIHSNSHKKILEMRLYKSRFGEPEEEALNTQMLEEESTCSEESTTSYHNI